MPEPEEEHLGLVFAALGDPTRREVMRRLAERGPVNATDLAHDLPITRQAVAKHLSALQAAGLVAPDRQGREVLYRLMPGPMDEATSWMDDVGRQWDSRLEGLVRHLDEG